MLQHAIQSTRTAVFLEQLWRAFPGERDRLRPYIEKVKSYRNECGCAAGGVFFIGGLLVLLLDCLFFHEITGGGWLATALRGAALVFSAGILGKAVGIAIARIRLALTYRELCIRFRLEKD